MTRWVEDLQVLIKAPAIFFDRDGVLNVDMGYPHRPEQLVLIQGARQAVAKAKAMGYLVVVVTNQSGVARGLFGEPDVVRFNDRLNTELSSGLSLENHQQAIDAFYICPYHPEAVVSNYRVDHADRKPNPGMINRAVSDLSIDCTRSFLVGDKKSDIQAAEAAGIPGYLFRGGNLCAFLTPLLFDVRASTGL